MAGGNQGCSDMAERNQRSLDMAVPPNLMLIYSPSLLHGFLLNSAVQAYPPWGMRTTRRKDWVHKGRVQRTQLAPLNKICKVMAAKQCLRPPPLAEASSGQPETDRNRTQSRDERWKWHCISQRKVNKNFKPFSKATMAKICSLKISNRKEEGIAHGEGQ